jgi:hypothetical protein
MSTELKADKYDVQAQTVGVIIAWLDHESHLDGGDGDTEQGMNWSVEIQEKIGRDLQKLALRLQQKSKTYGK